MSEVASLIADMVAAGVDPQIIGRTAAAFVAQAAMHQVDEATERRRAKDRERKRGIPRNSVDSADVPSPSPSLEGSPTTSPITLTLTTSEKVTPNRARADDFELFWSNYPLKTAKGAARKAYASALSRIAGPDPPAVLLAAVALQADQWTETRFTPHASTWLNQDRWEDEISPRPERKSQVVHESFAERDARHRRENLERSYAASEGVIDLARRRRGESGDSEASGSFG